MQDPPPDLWELFIFDWFPKSLNRTQDKHWSHRHKRKREVARILKSFCLRDGGVPRFSGPIVLRITRLWGKRQRKLDTVNLYGSVKQLEDVMRKRKKSGKGFQGGLGIIEDDDPDHCDLRVNQQKNEHWRWKDYESTLIVVEGNRVDG